MKQMKQEKLIIRNATTADVKAILDLTEKVYSGMPPYPLDMLRGQINHYPQGHFVAQLGEKIVGYSAAIRVPGEKALKNHTWKEITGGGYGTTHEVDGDWLYGYEVCVDQEIRGYRIGQRFYDARKNLAKYLRLRGIVFAGRLPNLKKRLKDVGSPENYIEQVKNKKIKDPVLGFQLRNGFEVIGLIKNYLPLDEASLGYAAHLVWKNPEFQDEQAIEGKRVKGKKNRSTDGHITSVRVATVQYGQRRISSFEEFKKIVEYYVDVVSDYKCDFVLFPEL